MLIAIGLKYSASSVVFSSWEKPDERWYEIFQAWGWYILTNVQMMQRFSGDEANN